jgi:hypothetical protein
VDSNRPGGRPAQVGIPLLALRRNYLEAELPRHQRVGTMLVDGSKRPAIGRTPPFPPPGKDGVAERVRRHSRAAYGRQRQAVEDEIRRRLHLQEPANWAIDDLPRPPPEGSLGGSS